ncbi:MAG TPA: glycosyltransferase family 2 protein [Solirubrobacteraceae bacterium]|nr:glycosyltransferase family 2 protein [Solirubrobacteraceae bacterium]
MSVVICAYDTRRWQALLAAVTSVQRQTLRALETILVIDHNPGLLERARGTFHSHVNVVASRGEPGLSGARNTGVRIAGGEIVAFLDDDAVAERTWLNELTSAYVDGEILGTGGQVTPSWPAGGPPRWLPREFDWTVGCSYRGLPTAAGPVRNPIGANMSFRRDVLEGAGGFTDGIGRIGHRPLGCEETELSIRARQAHRRGAIMHVPAARVRHTVSPDRLGWRYFRARCFAEGLSKARVSAEVGADGALSSERTYTLRVLPRGVLRGLRDAATGKPSGLLRSGAIVAGLLITSAGYLRGRLAAR